MGSFEVPKAGQKGKVSAVVHGDQPVCRAQYNFRLSFSDGSKGAGSMDYAQVNTTGLRMRFGCWCGENAERGWVLGGSRTY